VDLKERGKNSGKKKTKTRNIKKWRAGDTEEVRKNNPRKEKGAPSRERLYQLSGQSLVEEKLLDRLKRKRTPKKRFEKGGGRRETTLISVGIRSKKKEAGLDIPIWCIKPSRAKRTSFRLH